MVDMIYGVVKRVEKEKGLPKGKNELRAVASINHEIVYVFSFIHARIFARFLCLAFIDV